MGCQPWVVQKNSWNQINQFQFSRKKISDQIPFFAISKMAKNQFLNWGKSLKLPEMQFHEKKFDLFDFTSFFALAFLNFLARCGNIWSDTSPKAASI